MRNDSLVVKISALIVVAAVAVLAFTQSAHTQAQSEARPAEPPRITQAIDESQLTRLTGNTHPLARPEFDRGAAAPGMMLHRMLLVLNRAPEQEAALQQLILDLHDKSSPSFHKWLTPEQFGRQFGPADGDIQTVTSWLESHGFQVAKVAKGRNVIEFSGTVSQLSEAFHTGFHQYSVHGENHWANTNDPEIPTALVPVVGGIASLHNFVKKPHVHFSNRILEGTVAKSKAAGATQRPAIDFQGGAHGVGAADFAKIYNVPNSLLTPAPARQFNGDGIIIGVVGRSNINVSDITNYRNLFGAPPNPKIILDGPDPGNLGGGEEVEAVLDVTESGQVAPNATVDFVVSQITETTDGVDLSQIFIIDNNLSAVMTESFGLCEQEAGAARENLENSLAEQSTAQGISFFASTGDSGADGCDNPNTETVAQGPIAVQVPAALPFATAVGGTMFPVPPADASFWAAQDGTNHESALGYIIESTWNESCSAAQCGQNANIGAGGGGKSILFAKPAYQAGFSGSPADTQRDVPDVALNSASGHDSPVICVEDILQQFGVSCVPSGANMSFAVLPVGGTSASTPGFAGIIALINQSTGERQGLVNFVLYKLFASETASPGLASCNASTGKGPTNTSCVFNDVTAGNNTVPNGPNASGFTAAQGYDKATGLGSVNVTNLISKWTTAARMTASTTTLSSVSPTTLTHGASVNVSIRVAATPPASGTPTGDVSLIASPVGGAGAATAGGIVSGNIAAFALSNGTIASSTTTLPGGTYTLTAHYEGDGTFLPSASAPSPTITVMPEASQTIVQFVLENPNTGAVSIVTSEPYGANDAIRVNVHSSTAGSPCAANTVGNFGCPTGVVAMNKNPGSPLDGGSFALNSLGYTEDQAVIATLSPGSYMIQANYPGDNSFKASSGSDSITITPATTSAALSASTTSIASAGSTTLTATVTTQSFGTPPTGMVTFTANGSTVGTAAVTGSVNANTGFAVATAQLGVSGSQLQNGSNSITATYNGDANYSASPASAAVTVTVGGSGSGSSFNLALNPSTVTVAAPGRSGQSMLTVTAVGGFNGMISLTPAACTGLPALSSCSFSPTSITGSGSATVTITTTAAGSLPPAIRPSKFNRWTPLAVGSILCLLGLIAWRFQPRRGVLATLGWITIAILFTMMSACGGGGGGGGGTPVGLDSGAKITLTSGAASTSITFAVNVQ